MKNFVQIMSIFLLLQSFVVFAKKKNQFFIDNQTGRDVYLKVQFTARQFEDEVKQNSRPQSVISGNMANKVLNNGQKRVFSLPTPVKLRHYAPTQVQDTITVVAFYTDAQGICYYDGVQLSPSGALKNITLHGPSSQSTQSSLSTGNNMHLNQSSSCDLYYQMHVDPKASTMPANKP